MVVTRDWGKGNGMMKIQWYRLKEEVLRILSVASLSGPVTSALATKTPSIDSEKLKRQHSKTRNVWSVFWISFTRPGRQSRK